MDNSTAVMSSAKFGSEHAVRIKVRAKWNFYRIWIVVVKPAVKWTPGYQIYMHQKQASAILSDNTVLPIQHNTIIENKLWLTINSPQIIINGNSQQPSCCYKKCSRCDHMCQVTKMLLSCYLVLLSLIAKLGNRTATSSWLDHMWFHHHFATEIYTWIILWYVRVYGVLPFY